MSGNRVQADFESYRADFPILASQVHGVPLVYLDNAASTQRPRQVIDAMVKAYEESYANVHRGIHHLAEQATALFEGAREKVREFLNARRAEEIVFTSGTTAAVNLVARSWGDANLGPGDEILLTEMEHHSNLVPWYQLAERTGARVHHVPLSDDGQLILEQFDRLLTERTRLVAVTAVSNVLGTINPVAELVRRAHGAGALALVDAAQGVPHLPTDVQLLGCDFLAFSGHKMLGPSGVGVLYGRRELLDAMPPFLGGGSMIRDVTLAGFEPADVPARFEAGTPPIVPAIGLGAAIDYLKQIGMEAINAHEQRLTRRAHEVLESVGGVRILGPDVQWKGGMVSFTLTTPTGREVHAHDIAQRLDRLGVAVRPGHHCAKPLHRRYGLTASARASFYFYNTLEEVDRLGEGLAEVRQFFDRPRRRRTSSVVSGPG
jgi:cysteine desulfurase/selenocysteine lyase